MPPSSSISHFWDVSANRRDCHRKGGGAFECGNLLTVVDDCTQNAERQSLPALTDSLRGERLTLINGSGSEHGHRGLLAKPSSCEAG
jgi:hypothetical protein